MARSLLSYPFPKPEADPFWGSAFGDPRASFAAATTAPAFFLIDAANVDPKRNPFLRTLLKKKKKIHHVVQELQQCCIDLEREPSQGESV